VLFNRFDQYIASEASQGVVVDENESGQKIKYNDLSNDFASPYYVDITSYNTGIGTVHIQDNYKWSTSEKITATQFMLSFSHWRGQYYINYSSTTEGATIPNPQNLANTVNAAYSTFTYTKNKPSGIFCMDFATADLCRYIILNNEAVCSLVEGTDGNINYSLNRKTGVLTISGNGAMNGYGYSSDVGANGAGSNAPWGDQAKNALFEGQYNSDFITSVVINEGVTSIGSYAFYGMDHLASVSIPSSVTSIGEGAFARCTSLTTVDISDTNTSSIGYMAFIGCTNLSEFDTTDNVADIGLRGV
jgi:surface protein